MSMLALNRTTITVAVAVCMALVLSALWLVLAPRLSGEEPSPPETPEWPPFIAVFEVEGNDFNYNGVVHDIVETKRLVWNSKTDWKETTIDSTVVQLKPGKTYSTVGSWRQLKDGIFTEYHSYIGDSWSFDYSDGTLVAPHMFAEAYYYNLDVPNRNDGETVLLDVVVCDGECDTSRARDSDDGQTVTAGKRYNGMAVVFTDDDNHIPLQAGSTFFVTELHTNPPTPTPTPTPIPTPTATPVPLNGNPRAESVTGASVTVNWDRLGRPQSGGARDYRVNYRRSASESWTFGNYVTSESFGNQRPQTTVPRGTADPLRCNTQYEFQVVVQLSDGWHDYGEFTASTGAC